MTFMKHHLFNSTIYKVPKLLPRQPSDTTTSKSIRKQSSQLIQYIFNKNMKQSSHTHTSKQGRSRLGTFFKVKTMPNTRFINLKQMHKENPASMIRIMNINKKRGKQLGLLESLRQKKIKLE